ncbi:sulfite exporter TauE/SafE family protein [Staphylococcus epidermidis]|uniref:sulfite exporter TauE/SafE family protein n=1 Tax=Staphylococcus epidermidis TaxID=1282 RepID=UPI0028797217|nr:TSUP family transporter [Staphylococcus epidermidis]MCG1185132.1 sulfite exporter TauE/SafE family protein [Staphylococcus epidermidis]MCG1186470.1 sulfite exporter TauE/SafE family protein [Staphylococcus epidermidis]MCG1422061.1 sulfite exporter TauE/SafE family protein [Staphylococcus epidermidis]MCG1550770.1 sulfite exporter TauE/SafE family protein [Staphylococcus epidermidis]MCG1555351.1 sulfite exporter TauE/SafE family protein [Staphylococcus epidermidis]
MIIMLLIGIFGGFISGLVGIGGAIIIYPMLLLLPPLVGLPTYSAYIASGLTSSQVFFSTLSGSFKAYKNKDFSRTLVLNMGSGMIIGSILGAILANLINVQFVNMVYIIIALLALILMFIKVAPSTSHIKFNRLLLITIGGIIGLVSGIVGAGGAFIIKLLQGYIPVNSAIPLILGSILFTPLGMKIGQKIPDYIQKMIVSILIVIAIIKLIF